MADDESIHDQLRDAFGTGVFGVVAVGGRYAGLYLPRYNVDSQSTLRHAFEIIDEIPKIIEALDLADKGANSDYYTGGKSIEEFPGGALNRIAAKKGLTTADYIDNQVQEAKERAWAKADVLWSIFGQMVDVHETGPSHS